MIAVNSQRQSERRVVNRSAQSSLFRDREPVGLSWILLAESSRGELWRLLGFNGFAGFVLGLALFGAVLLGKLDVTEAVVFSFMVQLIVFASWLLVWPFWRFAPAYRTRYFIDGSHLVVATSKKERCRYDLSQYQKTYVQGDTDWFHGLGFFTPGWTSFPRVYLYLDTKTFSKTTKPIFLWGRNSMCFLETRTQSAQAQILAGQIPVELEPWEYRETPSRIDQILLFGWWVFWFQTVLLLVLVFALPVS